MAYSHWAEGQVQRTGNNGSWFLLLSWTIVNISVQYIGTDESQSLSLYLSQSPSRAVWISHNTDREIMLKSIFRYLCHNPAYSRKTHSLFHVLSHLRYPCRCMCTYESFWNSIVLLGHPVLLETNTPHYCDPHILEFRLWNIPFKRESIITQISPVFEHLTKGPFTSVISWPKWKPHFRTC